MYTYVLRARKLVVAATLASAQLQQGVTGELAHVTEGGGGEGRGGGGGGGGGFVIRPDSVSGGAGWGDAAGDAGGDHHGGWGGNGHVRACSDRFTDGQGVCVGGGVVAEEEEQGEVGLLFRRLSLLLAFAFSFSYVWFLLKLLLLRYGCAIVRVRVRVCCVP